MQVSPGPGPVGAGVFLSSFQTGMEGQQATNRAVEAGGLTWLSACLPAQLPGRSAGNEAWEGALLLALRAASRETADQVSNRPLSGLFSRDSENANIEYSTGLHNV